MRFKRALEPMETYKLRTRIMGWNSKWLFIETCFVGSSGRTKAAGLCKVVLSEGGHQVAPADALRRLGYADDVESMARASEGGKAECMPIAARAMLEADTGFGKDS